jgi:predicted transcriptional regulator
MIEHPEIVRAAVLTDKQIEIVKYVNSYASVSSPHVAERFDMSVANASTQLKRLVKRGYLGRHAEAAPSGGVEYAYYGVLT